ncbi:uncharacterized protein LOC117151292 [Bombus impatiens]|uniref:Uncharacterized protein LOC117151292 n=1 Tax=Bombus impatiens TaxID=132113 RepID=A0A6P8LMF4_BOMIM|nr:uncharacterized protein LOC117151292 [Bombus impatiens]
MCINTRTLIIAGHNQYSSRKFPRKFVKLTSIAKNLTLVVHSQLIRSARDAKHYDKETLFAGGMKRITEHRLVRDLIRRNRAELAKIEGEIEIWKRTYSESVKMLKQLSIQENNLTAELKDTLRLRSNRSRKHRSEIMKRTCVAHVVQNNSQESSLRETSSENSRLPTYPAL